MDIECIIEFLSSPVQESSTSNVKVMYNSYIIGLTGSTDPFCAKNKVNTMHNECIIELICLSMQRSPKRKVKAMYNSCIIERFCLTDLFCTESKVNTIH